MRMAIRKSMLLLILVSVTLFSIILPAFATIPCQCHNPPDLCACFIQLGDVDKCLAKQKDRAVTDHKGNRYPNTRAICEAYNLS